MAVPAGERIPLSGVDRVALSPREREILDTIVGHYIQTGTPVSSRAIAKVNREGLSAATLRSIMADLEEAGYVTHPHTSAGRVPTDSGYRYYVDSLTSRPSLSTTERRQIAEHIYAAGGIDSLLARCCRLLSTESHQIGVGTLPDLQVTVFRHVELVKLTDRRLLVLFVAASGLVFQHVIDATVEETQAELERQANFLNVELAGRTLPAVRDHLAQLMREERVAYDRLARRALQFGAQYFAFEPELAGEVCVEGAESLLDRKDLAEFDRMKALLSALEDKRRAILLLNSCLGTEGIVTAIGSENAAPELAGCSLVATSYRFDESKAGMVGIIGPTRMDYDRAMALVEYVAQLLGEALAASRS